jgi:DNA-binding NarL/FixJ family response regulator
VLRVVVVEDDPAYRTYLEALLRYSGDLGFVRAFECAEALLAYVDGLPAHARLAEWDLALIALDLNGEGGRGCVQALKKAFPEAGIVVLSVRDDVHSVLDALRNGADGYLLKHTSADRLLTELRTIHAGGAPLSPEVSRALLKALREGGTRLNADGNTVSPRCFDLTPRELEVLRCLARGCSYKGTARELGIGVETVRTHVRSLYPKLGVHSAAQAVSNAIRQKLL